MNNNSKRKIEYSFVLIQIIAFAVFFFSLFFIGWMILSVGYSLNIIPLTIDLLSVTIGDIGSLFAGIGTIGLCCIGIWIKNDWKKSIIFKEKKEKFDKAKLLARQIKEETILLFDYFNKGYLTYSALERFQKNYEKLFINLYSELIPKIETLQVVSLQIEELEMISTADINILELSKKIEKYVKESISDALYLHDHGCVFGNRENYNEMELLNEGISIVEAGIILKYFKKKNLAERVALEYHSHLSNIYKEHIISNK
ncbi:MAG: hypothetical protein OCC45_08425 [Desulfotalea sp.]